MKKFFAVLLTVMVMAVACACEPSENMLAAYGDDSIIASSTTSATSTMSSTSNVGSKLTYKAKKMTGVEQLKTLDIAGRNTLDLTLTVTGGDFKVVLVSGGGDVYVIAEGNTSSPVEIPDLSGTHKLRVVGKYAEGVELIINF